MKVIYIYVQHSPYYSAVFPPNSSISSIGLLIQFARQKISCFLHFTNSEMEAQRFKKNHSVLCQQSGWGHTRNGCPGKPPVPLVLVVRAAGPFRNHCFDLPWLMWTRAWGIAKKLVFDFIFIARVVASRILSRFQINRKGEFAKPNDDGVQLHLWEEPGFS